MICLDQTIRLEEQACLPGYNRLSQTKALCLGENVWARSGRFDYKRTMVRQRIEGSWLKIEESAG